MAGAGADLERGVSKRQKGLGMVERAVIAAQWRKNVSTSRIHALIGDDSHELVQQAGRVFFVALGAAIIENVASDDVEVRILRSCVNALHDQAGVAQIDAVRRQSIKAGLEAAVRLLDRMPYPSIVKSACDLHVKELNKGVWTRDFREMVQKLSSQKL